MVPWQVFFMKRSLYQNGRQLVKKKFIYVLTNKEIHTGTVPFQASSGAVTRRLGSRSQGAVNAFLLFSYDRGKEHADGRRLRALGVTDSQQQEEHYNSPPLTNKL
jgi:hypothetical protein